MGAPVDAVSIRPGSDQRFDFLRAKPGASGHAMELTRGSISIGGTIDRGSALRSTRPVSDEGKPAATAGCTSRRWRSCEADDSV